MSSEIDRRIEELRGGITRVNPLEAAEIIAAGGLLIDIRPTEQRQEHGEFTDSIVIERNVLEWRLDPSGDHRLAEVATADTPIVITCQEGYASTLAVASLERIGLTRVSDLAGGFVAWKDAGLPVRAPWPTATVGVPPEVVRV